VRFARALALGVLFAPLACGGGTRGGKSEVSAPSVGRPGIELREGQDRPRIALAPRDGDPETAVSIAVAHDFGSRASLALGQLLENRLKRGGFRVTLRAHQLGFLLTTLVDKPALASAFIRTASEALGRPIQPNEVPREPIVVPRLLGAAEAAVASCSGELGEIAAPSPIDRATLERFRVGAHSKNSVAFGAVGKRELLDAAADALEETSSWPANEGPIDPLGQNSVGVEAARHGERRLSLALRIADPARALGAARAMGEPTHPLAVRLAALDPAWEIERVVATSRSRGACLRVDLRSDRIETVRWMDVARAAKLVDVEAHAALGRVSSDPWFLDEAVLGPSDARVAAAAAAWRALTNRTPASDEERRFVSFVAQPGEASASATVELERALLKVERGWTRSSMEQRSRLETGQGELWALVASTCGTVAETASDAGAAALIMQTLAERSAQSNGVSLEPWVTADGVGIFAHAPRATPRETPEEQARRVGDALGRALVTARISGPFAAEARESLLDELGPAPRPGFFATLGALSGGHPSWLDPRGAVTSLSALEIHVLEARRRTLLAGPLRLAVIANATREQPKHVEQALEEWLRPHRLEPTSCPIATPVLPKKGEMTIEPPEGARPSAYVAFPIAAVSGGVTREAEWTAYLMNRDGGWLGQTLGADASARAAVLGGKNAAGFVIEVQSAEDPAPSVASVRSLLDRLSRGGATEAEADIARRRFAEIEAEASRDPRFRLASTWSGTPARRTDLASLRRFQQSLAADRHVVVYVRSK
jgi:hypothetical protein